MRDELVAYMRERRDWFELFVEDDEPFLDYVERTLGFELPLVTLFWCVAVPVYVFGLGGLYSYMLSQRSKALGYASKKKD